MTVIMDHLYLQMWGICTFIVTYNLFPPTQEAQNKLNAKIAEPIFHRVRDVAPNKVYTAYSGYLYPRLESLGTHFSVLLNLNYDLDPKFEVLTKYKAPN
jgi:hypothetical protein